VHEALSPSVPRRRTRQARTDACGRGPRLRKTAAAGPGSAELELALHPRTDARDPVGPAKWRLPAAIAGHTRKHSSCQGSRITGRAARCGIAASGTGKSRRMTRMRDSMMSSWDAAPARYRSETQGKSTWARRYDSLLKAFSLFRVRTLSFIGSQNPVPNGAGHHDCPFDNRRSDRPVVA
jgi:hypothetical protein